MYQPPDVARTGGSVPYAELHAHSAYSFLDGAGTPEELVEEAARLDLRAIALTDHDGLYGVVRFAEAAKELDMATVFGAELSLGNTARTEEIRRDRTCWCWPAARRVSAAVPAAGVGASGRRREGQAALRLRHPDRGGRRALAHPDRLPQRTCAPSAFRGGPEAAGKALAALVDRFGCDRVSIELTHHGHPLDDERNAALADLAPRFGVGLIATTAAHFAEPSGAGWRWRWVRSGPGTRWTRRPAGWRRWAGRT